MFLSFLRSTPTEMGNMRHAGWLLWPKKIAKVFWWMSANYANFLSRPLPVTAKFDRLLLVLYIFFRPANIFRANKCSTFQNVAHTVIASPVSWNWTGARTQDVGFVRPLFLLNSRKSGFNCLLSFCRNCCQKYNKGEQSLKHSQSATFINHGVWLTKKYPSLSHSFSLLPNRS